MAVIDIMRANVQRLISENPTTITIQRRIGRQEAGGVKWDPPVALAPITVRLYLDRPYVEAKATQRAALAGAVKFRQRGMLADHQADIQEGALVQDSFEVGGRRFVVRQVVPTTGPGGEVVSHQCVIEELV